MPPKSKKVKQKKKKQSETEPAEAKTRAAGRDTETLAWRHFFSDPSVTFSSGEPMKLYCISVVTSEPPTDQYFVFACNETQVGQLLIDRMFQLCGESCLCVNYFLLMENVDCSNVVSREMGDEDGDDLVAMIDEIESEEDARNSPLYKFLRKKGSKWVYDLICKVNDSECGINFFCAMVAVLNPTNFLFVPRIMQRGTARLRMEAFMLRKLAGVAKWGASLPTAIQGRILSFLDDRFRFAHLLPLITAERKEPRKRKRKEDESPHGLLVSIVRGSLRPHADGTGVGKGDRDDQFAGSAQFVMARDWDDARYRMIHQHWDAVKDAFAAAHIDSSSRPWVHLIEASGGVSAGSWDPAGVQAAYSDPMQRAYAQQATNIDVDIHVTGSVGDDFWTISSVGSQESARVFVESGVASALTACANGSDYRSLWASSSSSSPSSDGVDHSVGLPKSRKRKASADAGL